MLLVNVAGGTGAGRKRPPRVQPPGPWMCRCGKRNPSYATNCLADHCRHRRGEK